MLSRNRNIHSNLSPMGRHWYPLKGKLSSNDNNFDNSSKSVSSNIKNSMKYRGVLNTSTPIL